MKGEREGRRLGEEKPQTSVQPLEKFIQAMRSPEQIAHQRSPPLGWNGPSLIPESFPLIGQEQPWKGVASGMDAAEDLSIWHVEDVHQPAFLQQVLLKDLSTTSQPPPTV